jgi:hypothetical protein
MTIYQPKGRIMSYSFWDQPLPPSMFARLVASLRKMVGSSAETVKTATERSENERPTSPEK